MTAVFSLLSGELYPWVVFLGTSDVGSGRLLRGPLLGWPKLDGPLEE